MKKYVCLVVLLAAVLIIPQWAMARVQGPCSDCHTMHNSQNAATVVSGGPYRALTKGDCVGCHTGTNTDSNNIPYVLDTTAPTYGTFGISGNTLAGGNFYWVKNGDDTAGHNVVTGNLAGQDGNIGLTPPGWNPNFDANGQVANGASTWSQQLTCAGTFGCHGKHDEVDDFAAIRGAHHGVDDPDGNGIVDGDGAGNYTVATSFRFLYGIKGIEDSDWEYQPTSTAHNQYYAVDRTSLDISAADSHTINYLCAECHGDFHSGSNVSYKYDNYGSVGSPWLRHPSDFALSSASGQGYTNYPGPFGDVGTYWPGAPLGSSDLSNGVISTVQFTGTDDIVLCISCHRAHGSPNADLLRWSYSNCQASSGDGSQCGCFACHTNKY